MKNRRQSGALQIAARFVGAVRLRNEPECNKTPAEELAVSLTPMMARYKALIRWKLAKYLSRGRGSAVKCPVCGDKTEIADPDTRFSVVRCTACGHATASRMPCDEELRALYDGLVYWHKDKGHGGMQSFTEGSWEGWLAPRLDSIYRLAGFADTPPKQVLEIGCSEGRILYELKLRGHEVLGYECNEQVAALASNTFSIPIAGEAFAAPKVAGRSFDLVLAYHILEHVADIVAMVRDIAAVMKPGGKAVIEVPIETVYDNPDHVHFFTCQSIRLLLGRLFETVELSPNGFVDANGRQIDSAFVVASGPKANEHR
jgi:2-polyprenyl-3-methyl-5-hydroxy-6-metoxy-1,4-benzoquinol methylase